MKYPVEMSFTCQNPQGTVDKVGYGHLQTLPKIKQARKFQQVIEQFLLVTFSKKSTLSCFFGLRGGFLTSNSLNNLGGQKNSRPCQNPMNLLLVYDASNFSIYYCVQSCFVSKKTIFCIGCICSSSLWVFVRSSLKEFSCIIGIGCV